MTAPAPASRDEEQLVAYYLVHRHSHPRCSQVRPEHLRDPVLRAGWERALARDDWTDTELGIPLDRLVELSDRYVSDALLPALERKLVQEWSRRRLVTAGSAVLQELAKGADLEQTVATLREILGETEAGSLTASRPLGDVMQETMTEWAHSVRSKDDRRTVPMPLGALRRKVRGWLRGRLHIIGGRTSEHKTTFARMSAWYPAQHGFRTVFVTLEDKDTDIAARTIASEIKEFSTAALITGVLPDGFPLDHPERYADVIRRVEELCSGKAASTMRVLDKGARTKSQLLGVLRAEAARGAVLGVVDYVQLVEHDTGGDRDASFFRSLSAGLHQVAKETDMAILATAQIDKVGQRMTDEKGIPKASAMLFSSALQQDAFGVVMVGKPRKDPEAREFLISFEKWKAGERGHVQLVVDPVHDLIQEGWGSHGRTAA